MKQNGVSENLFQLIKSFLSGRFQRILLNGQTSDWDTIQAGIPQGSILGPLFFLIYMTYLTDSLNSNVNLFADDTSLFSEICDPLETANVLNSDLRKICEWVDQWKMKIVFNPEGTKPAQEVIFSRKSHSAKHPNLYFHNLVVVQVKNQKHLELKLDKKLNFKEHLKDKFAIVNKEIGMLKKLSNYLPRHSLVTLYKAFVRPHLDYADIIYDKPNNVNICNKIESLQHNSALDITGAIRGSSKEKLYQELDFECLNSRRWLRKLCQFFKIVGNKSPNYLYIYVSRVNQSYQTKSGDKFLDVYCRTEYFANFFYPYAIKEWNNLNPEIHKSVSYGVSENSLLKFIRSSPSSLFNVFDSLGIKLLTRLRLGLSHLREHKFNRNFQDTINPLCSCSLESESTTPSFLRCQNFTNLRKCLINELIKIDSCILTLDEKSFTKFFLYGDGRYDTKQTKI